jgi:hypothetical protein
VLLTKCHKFSRSVFSSTVGAYRFDLYTCQILDHGFKNPEFCKGLIFAHHKIDPRLSEKIISKRDKVF